MSEAFITDMESVARLYGDVFYIIPGGEVPTQVIETPKPQVKVENLAPEQPAAKVVTPKPIEEPVAQKKPVEPEKPSTPASVETPTTPSASGLQWRVKPTSKMLFILHQSEMKDAQLTDFLKKIVAAIGLPFETAGFGIINGAFDLRVFESMPNRYGVVFDGSLWHKPHAMAQFGDNEIFFTDRLAVLQDDKDAKTHLWKYLKELKEALV